jgi:hypothetical protein
MAADGVKGCSIRGVYEQLSGWGAEVADEAKEEFVLME